MRNCVYRLDSGFELRLEDVHAYLDDYDPPKDIEKIETQRRGNKLVVSAVGTENGDSKYTPAARLKADVAEKRMYETEDGWSREPPEKRGPRVPPDSSEEPETESKLVEFACFKGDRESVLQNTDLQYQMFEVLCDLAEHADDGELTAVVAVDGELSATRIVEGEERVARLEVIEESQGSPDNTSDWRNNNLISD